MIDAHVPSDKQPQSCTGCGGAKGAPLAAILSIYHRGRGVEDPDLGVTLALCEECGRNLANAVGFMCIREGGWSKLEPQKKKSKAKVSKVSKGKMKHG